MDGGPAHPLPRSQVTRGRLVRLEADQQSDATLEFQYNPETVTRTRTGRWEPRKRRRDPRAVETPQQHRQLGASGTAALMAESETISFQLVFDVTEALLATAGGPAATEADPVRDGVLPKLAFLELVSLGREPQDRTAERGSATPGRDIRPVRPDELLLELGQARWFPCVLTDLTITEQKFSPALVPIRARADLKLTVLEPVENANNQRTRDAFEQLLRRRQELAAQAGGTSGLAGLMGGGTA
ncbi:hypothetical protein [Micromonospora sp. NPDC005806]|uniref:CIS tube protein n=1 Tax=Micromonospora sp. NPDC005806 TaxID=3364234 RepID=UPI00369691D2